MAEVRDCEGAALAKVIFNSLRAGAPIRLPSRQSVIAAVVAVPDLRAGACRALDFWPSGRGLADYVGSLEVSRAPGRGSRGWHGWQRVWNLAVFGDIRRPSKTASELRELSPANAVERRK